MTRIVFLGGDRGLNNWKNDDLHSNHFSLQISSVAEKPRVKLRRVGGMILYVHFPGRGREKEGDEVLEADLDEADEGRVCEVGPDLHLADHVLVFHASYRHAVLALEGHRAVEVKAPLGEGLVAEDFVKTGHSISLELFHKEG
jgi:hypothetical protein